MISSGCLPADPSPSRLWCRKCGAVPGAPCLTNKGKEIPKGRLHRERLDRARRAHLAAFVLRRDEAEAFGLVDSCRESLPASYAPGPTGAGEKPGAAAPSPPPPASAYDHKES